MKVYPFFYRSLKSEYGDDVSITFVAQTNNEAKDIYSKIGTDAKVIIVPEYFKEHWDSFTLERLKKFEDKYCDVPIWNTIYQDRFLVDQPYDYCVKITCGYFCLYDELFENEKYDYYIDETLAILASCVAYIVAIKNGVDYCAQMLTKGFDTEGHYYLRDPMQYNCNFNPNYTNCQYPNEIVHKATEYYEKMQNSYVRPGFMNSSGVLPRFHLGYLRLPVTYLVERRKPEYNNPYEYVDYQRYKHTFDGPKFFFRYKSYKKYYKQPDYTDKYVFFPLHFQPEATTLVCAERYEKQLFFIDQISKSLPSDTKLYVKEHYAVLGHRDPDFYKKMQHYPNTVIIDPLVQAKDLILHSDAVITLTGTAGWEAFVYGKPVICCGNVFYQNAPGVVSVSDIYLNYQRARDSWVEPTRKEIIQYICEHIRTMSDGCQCATNPGYENPENLSKLGMSLVNELRKRTAKSSLERY